VCVVDRDGRVLWQGKVPSEPEPLVKRLAEWSGVIDLAGIEACPLSEWLHRGLREAGLPVVCVETRHAQRFLSSRPVKTDKNDARGIAEKMRLGHYRPVHVKSPPALVDAKEIGRGETQLVAGGVVQTACRVSRSFSTRKAGFALDSLLEGSGFEPSVPPEARPLGKLWNPEPTGGRVGRINE
jgi:hypothetical protein